MMMYTHVHTETHSVVSKYQTIILNSQSTTFRTNIFPHRQFLLHENPTRRTCNFEDGTEGSLLNIFNRSSAERTTNSLRGTHQHGEAHKESNAPAYALEAQHLGCVLFSQMSLLFTTNCVLLKESRDEPVYRKAVPSNNNDFKGLIVRQGKGAVQHGHSSHRKGWGPKGEKEKKRAERPQTVSRDPLRWSW